MKYTIATVLLATALIVTTFGQNLTINVGEGGLKFNPAAITAAPGSIITFAWINTIQHSVVQSASADSCTPAAGGFNTQMKAGESWTFTVPADKPKIWFYCNVSTHCQQGMKGVLTVSGVPDPNPSTSPGNPSTSPGDPPPNGLSPAKIAGITVASIVLLVGIVLGSLVYKKSQNGGNGNDGGNARGGGDIELLTMSSSSIVMPSFQYPDPSPHAESSAPFSEMTFSSRTTGESITSSLATSTDDSKMTVTLPAPASRSTVLSNRNRHNRLTGYRSGNIICHAEDKATSEDAKVKDLSDYDQFGWKYTRMSLDRYLASTRKLGSTKRILTRLPDCRPLLNILSTYLIIEQLKSSKVAENYRNSSEIIMKCAQAPPLLA
ncbi:10307_t:CDS:2 [Paraglomus occultum]|uniref:10307_t:CDS:1 n=1 Tax=Paraglomus occultum TaxID=144539 RepID=A0A9N8VJ28_9GLOM|nr:10307_t:CDS:2 [Paraglomus occultum]